MYYLLSCILVMILSAVVVYPAGALPHRHKVDKSVLKEIRRARQTGRYGDLTNRPETCDRQERDSGGITRIVVHSTHVVPSISFEDVLIHSLTTCAFTHYYIDRDGTVIRRFKDSGVAFHTRSVDDAVNKSSVGIELYSTTVHERSGKPFTSRQTEALAHLIEGLMNTYHIGIEQVSRHADYSPLVDCSTIPASYSGDCRAYINDHLDPYGWTDAVWGKFLKRFRPIEVIKSGSGTGTVNCRGVSGIPGRDPSTDCMGTVYVANPVGKSRRVTLKATPLHGSDFTGWDGACTGRGRCTVRMDSPKTVTVTFEKPRKDRAITIAEAAEYQNHLK